MLEARVPFCIHVYLLNHEVFNSIYLHFSSSYSSSGEAGSKHHPWHRYSTCSLCPTLQSWSAIVSVKQTNQSHYNTSSTHIKPHLSLWNIDIRDAAKTANTTFWRTEEQEQIIRRVKRNENVFILRLTNVDVERSPPKSKSSFTMKLNFNGSGPGGDCEYLKCHYSCTRAWRCTAVSIDAEISKFNWNSRAQHFIQIYIFPFS